MHNNIFRPVFIEDFIGNKEIIDNLKVYMFSAIKRKTNLDHLLFSGPPGVGKTSLANIIAKEMGVKITTISGSNIEKISDLITVLSSINKNDILFIDEIHRLQPEFEEILYSVMEDFKIPINYHSEEANKIIEVGVEPFTLIGATTKIGNITAPLRDRFGIKFNFSLYSNDELKQILKINAEKLSLSIDDDALLEIAKRSKFTPRIAINFLKRINDFAVFEKISFLNKFFIESVFKKLKIDEYGLTNEDYSIIKILYENYHNNPVSLKSISILMHETITNLENIYEPYLVYLGIIERTIRGRKLTSFGKEIYFEKIFDKKMF